MYLEKEQAPKSSKKMLIAAASGLAIAGVATLGYVNQSDNQTFDELENLATSHSP